jgi:predicted CopG family antitoxin
MIGSGAQERFRENPHDLVLEFTEAQAQQYADSLSTTARSSQRDECGYLFLYTRKCTQIAMAHKTLTISEEAYDALARLKSKDESFTKVILRLAQRKSKGNLLDYVRSFAPDNELADRIEQVVKKRSSIRLRAAGR